MKYIILLFTGLSIYVLSIAQTPTITGFTPASGTAGTTVEITGTNLSGARSVNFGGFPIARFTVINSTAIVAVLGNGATGNITVSTPGGKATSAGTFTCVNKSTPECTWTGTVDSLWDNPLNWSCNKIPDPNSDVFILGGTPYAPYCFGNCEAKNIYIATMNTITTVDSAKYFLDLAYQYLSGDAGYGRNLSLYYTVDNDETVGPSGASDNDRRDIARYSVASFNAQLTRPFQNLYVGIMYANFCIKYIPRMPMYNLGTVAQKNELKRMYGEALTLKAQYYFELIRNWGDVPYTEKDTDYYFGLPQTNRDSINNILINELGLAETLLPWRSELSSDYIDQVENERITKAAAKALRARIALFAGGYSLRSNGIMQRPDDYLSYYQVARQECAEIMAKRTEHTLMPVYKDLWKNMICAHTVNDAFGEFLFQVKMEGGNSGKDSKLGYYNGPTVNSHGNRSINIVPSYFYSFDSTDTRRDVTCAPYNVSADGITKTGINATTMPDGKFRRDWISNPAIAPTDVVQYFGLNWPVIRFADVLLMYAEADNEINGAPATDAVAAFNEVRARGYGSAAYNINPATKSEFFNAIVKERSLEFGGEGIRKYDLLRWNLLEQKLIETKNNLILMSTFSVPYNNLPASMYYFNNATADDKNIWMNSFYYPEPVSTPAGGVKVTWLSTTNINTLLSRFAIGYTAHKNELLPFQEEILSTNPQIIQNPGY